MGIPATPNLRANSRRAGLSSCVAMNDPHRTSFSCVAEGLGFGPRRVIRCLLGLAYSIWWSIFDGMETKYLGDPALSILTVLAGGRRHGYAIIREAEELSGGRVRLKVSSLYAALDRLASDGLIIRAGDEAVEGRLRRYFALSDAGAQVLRAEADRLATQSRLAKERLDARSAARFASGVA